MVSERVYYKRAYDFAIKTYKRLKTNIYDNEFIFNTTYEMTQLGFNIKLGKKTIDKYKKFSQILMF